MTQLWVSIAAALTLVGQVEGSAGQNPRPRQGAITVDVRGPVILGFFPPFTKAEEEADDGGISEGLAHVRFALEDIARCYGNKSATYRLDVTRSVTLRDGKRTRRINIPRDWEHAVGIILVVPGRTARTIFATDGPSSLIELGPTAVADYFDAPACRRRQ